MLLIADCGSTKSEWGVISGGNLIEKKTLAGINPYQLDDAEIEAIVRQGFSKMPVGEIHFFSAGCGSSENRSRIHLILKKVFPTLRYVEVDSDLFGAALATCGAKAGIVGILGTGSSACVFDGAKIVEQFGGYGYILGDEGSGTVLGRSVLRLYLYKKLPSKLHRQLERQFEITPQSVLSKVYKDPLPNRFMASLAPFIYEHREEEIFQYMLHQHFTDYFELMMPAFAKWKDFPVHLLGSVAWFFQEEIRVVAAKFHTEIASVHQRPLDGLIRYYLNSPAL